MDRRLQQHFTEEMKYVTVRKFTQYCTTKHSRFPKFFSTMQEVKIMGQGKKHLGNKKRCRLCNFWSVLSLTTLLLQWSIFPRLQSFVTKEIDRNSDCRIFWPNSVDPGSQNYWSATVLEVKMHWFYRASEKATKFVRNTGKPEWLESELLVDNSIMPCSLWNSSSF